MYVNWGERLASGFTPFDWWLIIVLSLVAALIMRKWPQWPAAAAIAFFIDAFMPFIFRVMTSMPPDLAINHALTRLDDRGGIVVILRLAIYMLTIGAIYWTKRRYSRH
jgi:hypothetical protein